MQHSLLQSTDLSPYLDCDHVIDKSKENLWKTAESYSPKGYQVVFDANGVETLQESYNHVAPGGRLVVYGMLVLVIPL